MDTLNKKLNGNSKHAHVGEAAAQLLNESKKLAAELYEEGLNKMGVAEKDLEAYSNKLLGNVRKKPLQSVLIAGGIGFLLSAILRK